MSHFYFAKESFSVHNVESELERGQELQIHIAKHSIFLRCPESQKFVLLWNASEESRKQGESDPQGLRNNVYECMECILRRDLDEQEGDLLRSKGHTVLNASLVELHLQQCKFAFQTLKDLIFATRKTPSEELQKEKIKKYAQLAVLDRRGEKILALVKYTSEVAQHDENTMHDATVSKESYYVAQLYHHHTGKIEKPEEEYSGMESFEIHPIGIFESVFPEKNGTPRQGSIISMSRGRLKIKRPSAGADSLDGLQQFSHVWLIFMFHRNGKIREDHAKIRPPRLSGGKIGLYATRTPHRPNPIGLTVAKVDRIEKNVLYLSGVDLLDGTPIVDVKPYVSYSDMIPNAQMPTWIDESTVGDIPAESITFSESAREKLKGCVPHLKFYRTEQEIEQAIVQVLQSDPRPVYMRKKMGDKLYGFRIDKVNVRCSFDEQNRFCVEDVELW